LNVNEQRDRIEDMYAAMERRDEYHHYAPREPLCDSEMSTEPETPEQPGDTEPGETPLSEESRSAGNAPSELPSRSTTSSPSSETHHERWITGTSFRYAWNVTTRWIRDF